MKKNTYVSPVGGLPSQSKLLTDRAVFKSAYAVIPRGCFTDIVTSFLPFWKHMRMWVVARPMTGFAETFSQYVVQLEPNGGSDNPEANSGVQSVLFLTSGSAELTINSERYILKSGSYAYIPAGSEWSIWSNSNEETNFHWIRKLYKDIDGIERPAAFVKNENECEDIEMPNSNNTWFTKRFVEPDDIRHDMHVNIVTFKPGGVIPFAETHVMEHGIYILEGKAVYHLNQDWVEVEAGDFLWLRAFCPQACYAGGPGPFRYLLYKDVNRHMPFL
ncbi:MAG: (S)-ureidoglycine aminohydrolase [Rhodobacterales bacterium]|nr:(S)-ureidoglycine aminohydrolase [Rhodobacterales bacterium]